MSGGNGEVLSARGLCRTYSTSGGDVHACVDIDLDVKSGELLVVRGRSGSGKTTLLSLLGGLDRPTRGRVLLEGADLTTMSDEEVSRLRRGTLGYVFQSFGLLPMLSAAENVEVPLRVIKASPKERAARVREVLDLVGLADHADQRPYELSGGQQQRVALARAIAARPRILLADEPTGQLDSETATRMMDLIAQLVEEHDLAAVVTTHYAPLMSRANRVVELRDGHLDGAGD